MKKLAVIVGAGPAGLTAALELLRRSDVMPLVFEADVQVGGISKTIAYRGNRMDLGGHRFFSKSDWVMQWWQQILPVAEGEAAPGEAVSVKYQGQTYLTVPARLKPASADAVMLIRQRLSRIFYRRRFFDYPLTLSMRTFRNIGFLEAIRIGKSYGSAQLKARETEDTLEDFFINRFGDRLYRTFFKNYTEKVWGVQCHEISAEWGAQRIKGLSITKALMHAVRRPFRRAGDAPQRNGETSLIERFLYPKLGPGQMWEAVAQQVESLGGHVSLKHRVIGVDRKGFTVRAVTVRDESTGSVRTIACDHLISTAPITDLIGLLAPEDAGIAEIARSLPYRDFMTVGLLVSKMTLTAGADDRTAANGMPPDNWIYIQEADVKIGRLQIFNNWSPAMVADPATIWLGLEYFCKEGDALWSMQDDAFIRFAAAELEHLGMIDRRDVLDGIVVRVPKAYPAYFGRYRDFGRVRSYLNQYANLYPVGRNGMHRYNNQDHSMLAAKAAVDAIIQPSDKTDIWRINAEEEYHEDLGGSDNEI